jgi:hypothetical protein
VFLYPAASANIPWTTLFLYFKDIDPIKIAVGTPVVEY